MCAIIKKDMFGFFDVIIATVGGIAGIVGQTRSDKANTILVLLPIIAVFISLLNK